MSNEYPKALYKGGHFEVSNVEPEHVTVHSKAEEEAQNAAGWFEFGKAPKTKPQEPEKPDPMEPLRQEAIGLGIDIDHRWGEKRLHQEIEKVKKGAK